MVKNPVFTIAFENGNIITKTGIVKNGFAGECKEIIQRNNLQRGFIYARKAVDGKAIIFGSADLDKDVLQQFRNVWGFYA